MTRKPSRRLLSAEEVQAGLPEGWQGNTRAIWREYPFASYAAALAFTVRLAQHADATDHHPELLLSYRRVRVGFFTHDRGGVTALDLAGAEVANALADALPATLPPCPSSDPTD